MRFLKARTDPILLLVLVLSLPALAPLFAPGYFYEAHDGRHSVFYQVMFDAAVRDGALWPRWAMHHLQGYGYPTFVILTPLGFWLGELFVFAGAGFTQAARLAWASGVMLSAWGMLALLRWWLRGQPAAAESASREIPVLGRRVEPLDLAAAAGALLYVYAPYRLADIYVRGALNESLLLLWLPWLLLAWDRLLVVRGTGTSLRWTLAVLTLAGMWLTHSFAILSLTPLLMVWVLFRLVQRWAADRRAAGALRGVAIAGGLALSAAVGALLLSAVFLAPLLAESPLLDQQVYTSDTYNFRNHFVQMGQYFSPFWGYGYSDDPGGAGDGMGFQVGMVMLVAALAAVALLAHAPRVLRAPMAALALLALGFLLLMTPLAQPLWEAIPALAVIQFPWRLLVAASFAVCALGGLLLASLTQMGSLNAAAGSAGAGAGVLVLGLLAVVGSAGYAAPQMQAVEPWREDGRAVFRFEQEFPDMIVGTIWTTEVFTDSPMSAGYADPAYAESHGRTSSLERLTLLQGNGEILRQESAGASFGGTVRMATPGVVRVNLLDFPGWRVSLDGTLISYRRSGPIGLIELDVPQGVHQIKVRMGSTPARRLGGTISWAMALLILSLTLAPPAWKWWNRRREPAPGSPATRG